ncbi:Hypothetical protein NTJ_08992 [Nesidiocoris tenuis]|uniref:Uncharacterized protein n=1 Tax=Nesidiocoris tenuis TaxID=355587 RepID=A0ABN7AXT3_9HEMI|nr:Hypothetical protein NTJ_08992 [Nesidiocoris tenuis]
MGITFCASTRKGDRGVKGAGPPAPPAGPPHLYHSPSPTTPPAYRPPLPPHPWPKVVASLPSWPVLDETANPKPREIPLLAAVEPTFGT